MVRRAFGIGLVLLLAALPVLAGQSPVGQAAAPGQEGFAPISQLPPSQQLPAAPFLIAAYAFIWVALVAYLWSIRRRMGTLKHDIEILERRPLPRK